MTETVFTAVLAAVLITIYSFAFRALPGERWQVFASIPLNKTGENTWSGVNITFYGLLTGTGYTLALSVFLMMMTSAGVSSGSLLIISACMLVLFIPSAKIMAFIVERKRHTITIGGAVFVLVIAAPWIVHGLNFFLKTARISEGVFLASLITSYAIGEGFGRLACISFGCCYGKPVSELSPFFRSMFSSLNFTYTGKTKKISYHDHMDGVKTVPVQGITAVLYTASGLAGLYLFLKGHCYFSFFLSLVITQLWRFLSEFLRSDFRGGGPVSAYQVMSLVTLPYYAVYIILTGTGYTPVPALSAGLSFLWDPGVIMLLIIMWVGGVLYTGVSSVTSSTISIHVNEDKI